MCRLTITVFHHTCTHILTISTPSLNPSCPVHLEVFEYLPRKRCPKCMFWTSEFTDHEYEDRGTGVACGVYNGDTTRTVRIGRAQFWHEYGIKEKWERRKGFLVRMQKHSRRGERVAFDTLRRTEEEEGSDHIERSYFLDGEEIEDFTTQMEENSYGRKEPSPCFCSGEEELQEEGQQHVSLPCGDTFHEKCIKMRFIIKKSNNCPICFCKFNIFRPRPPYIPPNFYLEMFEDLAVKKGWLSNVYLGNMLIGVIVLLLIMTFMLVMPI